MSGALAERVFAEKMAAIGFIDIQVVERRPFGVDECQLAPLFTDDLIALMRKLIPSRETELRSDLDRRARAQAGLTASSDR